MRMRFWCMMFYFINFVDENDVLEKNSFASDVIWTANEFGSAFDVDEFEVNVCRRFSNTCACVFQQQLHLKLRFAGQHFISGSCEKCFEDDFGRFWNLSTRCKWTMLIFGM